MDNKNLKIYNKINQTIHTVFSYHLQILLILIILSLYFYGQIASNYLKTNFLPGKILNDASPEEIVMLKYKIKYGKLENYKKMHEEILSRKRLPTKISFNISPGAGYGNRLYSMLTSLVIALIANSSILIKWDNVDKYIQEPFYLSFSFQNSSFNFEPKNEEIFHSSDGQAAWKKHKDMSKLIKTNLPFNKSKIIYSSLNGYFFEICSNPNYYKIFYDYDLIKNKTMHQALTVIQKMQSNSNITIQNYIMKIGFEVGGNLLNRIWLPKPYLIEHINNVLKDEFEGYFIIGIQLRYHYISDELDSNTFIKCAQMIESLRFNTTNKKKGFKWFVTSDSSVVLDRLINEYKDKIIIGGGGNLGHIQDSSSNSYPRTIIDIELLSKCDELIITGGSTFGFVAAMKMSKLPYYVNGRGAMKECVKTELDIPSMTDTGFAVFR